jgi:hypothetical protein
MQKSLPHLCKVSGGLLRCCCCCCICGVLWQQCIGARLAGLVQLIAPVAVPAISPHNDCVSTYFMTTYFMSNTTKSCSVAQKRYVSLLDSCTHLLLYV